MNEQFLAFIWQHYDFDASDLMTTHHEKVQIIDLGKINRDAGADFENACVIIGEIKWVGMVEIHQKTSDWLAHQHHKNRQYDTVILHVVYENNLPKNTICRGDGSPIPVLELKPRIAPLMLEKYALLKHSQADIPCEGEIHKVSEKILKNTQDTALITRLSRKAKDIQSVWYRNEFDWEATFYQRLAEHFGFKKNNENFLRLAKAISLKIISKHADNQLQIESLLFGQAGFLEDIPADITVQKLQKEYQFLAHKYQLWDAQLRRSDWKFMRMRPANFPTVRLAQFMALVSSKNMNFTKIIFAENLAQLRKLFVVRLPEYWQKHYDFGKEISKPMTFGKSSVDNLILNVICPILVCYGQAKDQPEFVQKALQILVELPAENNQITRLWAASKMQNRTAYESQALLELYHNSCSQKKCLDCQIGRELLLG